MDRTRLRLVPTDRPPEVQGFTTAGKAVNRLPISQGQPGPLLTPAGWVALIVVVMSVVGSFGALLALKLTGGL